VIRQRRRQLNITQEQIARRMGVSAPYIGHLETGKRHPSEKIVIKLADILGFDRGELFLMANPRAKALLSAPPDETISAWEQFYRDPHIRQLHHITDQEMEFLSRVALMGNVRSPRHFIFILNSIRQALA
jgi:transcriptional regulator with XRE-family HTH domain